MSYKHLSFITNTHKLIIHPRYLKHYCQNDFVSFCLSLLDNSFLLLENLRNSSRPHTQLLLLVVTPFVSPAHLPLRMPNIDTFLLIIPQSSFYFPSCYLLTLFLGQGPTRDTTSQLDVMSLELPVDPDSFSDFPGFR